MKISLPRSSDSEECNSSDSESESCDLEDECDLFYDDDLTGRSSRSRVIDISLLKNNIEIESKLVCRFCNSPIHLYESKRYGLGSTFKFECNNNCEEQDTFSSCATTNSNRKKYTVNKRAVFAMWCIGADRAELQTFCGLMDMPCSVSKSMVTHFNSKVLDAASSAFEESASAAAKLEFDNVEVTESDVRDIDVSNDGSWMTKGHSSNIGTTSLIGLFTGKVLDSVTLSKQCKSCDYWEKNKLKRETDYKKWKEGHASECTKTHDGSSGSMEGGAAVTMFNRSIEKHSLRYIPDILVMVIQVAFLKCKHQSLMGTL